MFTSLVFRNVANRATLTDMAKRRDADNPMATASALRPLAPAAKPSSLLDTRVIYYGDNREQLAKVPEK